MITAAGSRSIHGNATPSLKYRSEVLGKAVLRAAAMLGIEPARLAQVLGISTSSISRLSRGEYLLKKTQKSWELAVLVVRLHQALETIMAGDEIAMRSWMWNPNTALHATTVEHIATVQGLVDVVAYVESSRSRV
jgi:hypothetical protein